MHLIWEQYYANGVLLGIRRKGSFWWKDITKLLTSFKGMAMIHLNDGASCLFWEDLWLNRIPEQQFPELFSFVKKKGISLKAVREAIGPEVLFHLPISEIALQQLLILAEDLNNLPETSEPDLWSYIWGSPDFSISKTYVHFTGHRVIHAAYKWLWKSSCQNKHKVFFWFLLSEALRNY